MPCSCAPEPVPFAVPRPLRECAPDSRDAAAICPRCLVVEPADDGPADPDFSRVNEAFPSGDAGVALALALGLLDSLAMNRQQIDVALTSVERGGRDPVLAIDRLLADPDVEPDIDLARRHHQLRQLFY